MEDYAVREEEATKEETTKDNHTEKLHFEEIMKRSTFTLSQSEHK